MSLAKLELELDEEWRYENGRVCPMCEVQIAPVPYEVTQEQFAEDPDMDWGEAEYCGICQYRMHLMSKDD
jgi:hypothetical protein